MAHDVVRRRDRMLANMVTESNVAMMRSESQGAISSQ